MKNQLNEFWSGLDKGKKIKLGVSAALIILSITAIILFTTRTKYEELFSRSLTAKESALIVEKLDEMGIDWEEGEGFNSILVPSDMKSRVRMELAKEGFASDGLTMEEAFNDTSWTMTQSDKDRLYNQALSTNLANSISQIDGVASAKVYLYKPKEKGFVLDNDEKATASVIIQKGIGASLTPNKILSIQTTVANAVGMQPEDVSVVDDSGNLLSQADDNSNSFNLSEQYATQQSYQSWVENSIDEFLETVFGTGNVAVVSNVKINFDSEITNIVEFKPPVEGSDEGLIRSLQQMEESTVNGVDGGVAGTESNTEDTTDYVQQDDNLSKYESASKTINYELNEINKQISGAPGKIESITVAVLINQDSLVDGELTDDKKEEIVKLIYAATGLDTKSVEVHASKFNDDNSLIQTPNGTEGGSNMPSAITIAILGVALLGAGLLAGFFINRRRKSKEKVDLEKIIDERTDEMSSLQDIKFDEEKSQFKSQINKFVDNKPDAVAQLLRSWLNED
ncbi:flagellar basal-body MS-ring/collar protein FliF [Sporosalibacterium faouarense]|uniref:flagellar basal-body MS-ring/collar protein FliF n=1 Tax=Sporosalibacterium faouarense TaxID=516123 RepID=UPI00192BAC13|nr:flagellar basal-body MS-ring/collar protein FliF [Sporosalibacterium faouarense]